MTGDTIINGTDIYTAYGAFVHLDGYAGLVQWPASKPVEYNDWQEEDGIEADLSALRFENKEFSLTFGVKGNASAMKAFYEFLCSAPTMTCNFASIGLQRVLRVIGMSGLDYAFAFSAVVVDFADDASPLDGYSYQAPSASHVRSDAAFTLDGNELSDYGITPLYTSLNKALLRPGVKPLLIRNVSTSDGATYDKNPKLWNGSAWTIDSSVGTVTKGAVELALTVGMTATSVAGFWRNYRAFLYDLTRQDANASALSKCLRTLRIDGETDNIRGYYLSQSVEDFTVFGDGYVMCKFTLSVMCTKFEQSGPYLEIRPTVIWVMPWATNDVLSNIDWNIR
jgi:hypothetical protein